MKKLYPLKFTPIFKDKIWGGQKIRNILGKDFGNLPNCGESWEISGVKGDESVVSAGDLAGKALPELLKELKGRLVGESVYSRFGDEFPLLIKFIDANEDLSIQVHPDDNLAKERHNSFGKTEMWYIFQADEGSKLVSGFNRDVSKEEYLHHLENGTLDEILNVEEVEAGDVFFIPAGRVHTIGKGICIAEIQQTSDITYRIYDFDRVDDKGNKRELHTDLALDALDYKCCGEYKTVYDDRENQPVKLVACPYFTTNKVTLEKPLERNYADIDSFVIYICFEGAFDLQYEDGSVRVCKGDSVLVPAEIKDLKLVPQEKSSLLEVSIC